MNYEEKAKRYDEALERMKSWVRGEHPECFSEAQKAAEFIFPELAESEDERIRKCIIDTLKNYHHLISTGGVTKEDMIAWLEKQGTTDSSIKCYSICQEPEEMRELLCEWDSDDSTWHEVAFYHSDNKTFWNGERQVENVTKWCYIDELFEKQGQTFTKKDVDDAYLKGVCDTKQELEKQGEQKQTWKPNAAQLIVIKSLIEDKNTSKVNKVILRGMLDEFKQYFKL